jgi:hypothetical protein
MWYSQPLIPDLKFLENGPRIHKIRMPISNPNFLTRYKIIDTEYLRIQYLKGFAEFA